MLELSLCLFLAAPAAASARPTSLKTEYVVNPLGLGTRTPRFAWRIESSRRGEQQTAYQVLVATDEAKLAASEGDLWDSGRVASDQSVHVAYAGMPLRSRQKGHWKVRIWDKKEQVSPWSTAASLEMGLLDPSDWQASWIGRAQEATREEAGPVEPWKGASTIWHPEGDATAKASPGTRYFRGAFELPASRPVKSASLLLAARGVFAAWVNGKPAGEVGNKWDWKRFTQIPVARLLVPGRNVVALSATNLSGEGEVGGVLQVDFADGGHERLSTGPGFKTAALVPGGWTAAAFDDRGWTPALVRGPLDDEQAFKVRPFVPFDPAPATHIRRAFELARPIRRARAYVSAKGVYALFVNGQRVSEDLFRPGWTDYRDRIQYQTYDVTRLVQTGANAVGLLLADGWYAGHVAEWGRENWGPVTRGLLQLEIEHDDGSVTRIVTDGAWKTASGPIVSADFQMGETYDARLEWPGWTGTAFDDKDWKAAAAEPVGPVPLVAQVGPSVRRIEELRPKTVAETPAGSRTFVYDLGQNMVGFVRLKAEGPTGTKVRLRFAEMLNPDGTLYTTNLRGARATDTYTLKGGGPEVYEPSFTFHGFRYVEVTGYPGRPALDAVTGVAISSAVSLSGSFETSNAMVNQLQHNIVWGQRGNYLDIPTDCPQRDERLGWMGDAQVFARTACFNADVAGFLTKWLQDVRDAQSPAGAFPNYAPDRELEPSGAPAWGDAGVIVPFTLYRCYGDTRVVADQYEAMKRWIAYIQEGNPDLLWKNRSGANFGDWLNIGADAPRDVLATAYFARSTDLLSRMARVLGKEDDAKQYEALFAAIRDAFQKAYVSPDGHIQGDTQTVYLLALHFGLLPEPVRPLTANLLVQDIEAKGGHLSTGVLGVSYLNPTLTEIGHIDLAYRLLRSDTFPSWGYSIKQGATTIWERWDGWTAEKGFQDPGMNSFNHYSLGSVGEWMYAAVGGIDLDPEVPGYKRFVLRPRPGGGLTAAKATYDSLYGLISSDWKIEDDTFEWTITVPPNTTAIVHLPTRNVAKVTEGGKPIAQAEGVRPLRIEPGEAIYEVGSGRYTFKAPPP